MGQQNSGVIAEYYDMYGQRQKCLIKNAEQVAEFKKLNKAYVHLLTDNMTPKMKGDKKLVGLVDLNRLQFIGFFD